MNFLIALTEKDKRFLVALLIIFIILFVLIAYIAKLIRYIMKKYGKAVDNYMYDMCYYKIIVDPKTFKKYVHEKERISVYYRTRWFIRIFVIITALFLVYALWIHKPAAGAGTFDFAKEALSSLTIKFSSWPKSKFFGIKIPSSWPHIIHKPSPIMTFPGVVTYIYSLFTLVFIIHLLNSALIYISRINRARKAATEVFLKRLDNLNVNNSQIK